MAHSTPDKAAELTGPIPNSNRQRQLRGVGADKHVAPMGRVLRSETVQRCGRLPDSCLVARPATRPLQVRPSPHRGDGPPLGPSPQRFCLQPRGGRSIFQSFGAFSNTDGLIVSIVASEAMSSWPRSKTRPHPTRQNLVNRATSTSFSVEPGSKHAGVSDLHNDFT
jgi:hypothetical protein